MTLNKKHCAVFKRLKARGVDIRFDELASLVLALGGQVNTKKGSSRSLVLNGVPFFAHEPHRQPMGESMVKRVLSFFDKASVDYAEYCEERHEPKV